MSATRTHTRASLALLLVASLGVAACSSDGGSSADSTIAATTPATIPPVGTTPGTAPSVDTTPATDATTTTVPAGPVYPLTGLPVTDEAAAQHPALVVKIDNNAGARPQSGLNEADLVYEEIVEVGTRFAAVFQSQGADPVGPIRSGRTQDIALLGSLNKPLFAWSGGNGRVTAAIAASDLFSLSNLNTKIQKQAGFFRSNVHEAPHNLYAQTTGLWSLNPIFHGPPAAQFSYRADGAAPTGAPSTGVSLVMGGFKMDWTFDAASGTYLRTSEGKVHKDSLTGNQLSTSNVIVLVVDYRPSPADGNSPEAQTLGSGQVIVFTGGTMVTGTWERADRLDPFTLKDADGNVIELTPGRTWVELAENGNATPHS